MINFWKGLFKVTSNNCSIKNDSEKIAKAAVKILLEKKGSDVRLYDVRDISPITDFYINVTGRSQNQVAALADYIDEELSKYDVNSPRFEGRRGDSWILVDYCDVIINVFDRTSREFYDLDRLLPQDRLLDITDLIADVDKKLKVNN